MYFKYLLNEVRIIEILLKYERNLPESIPRVVSR